MTEHIAFYGKGGSGKSTLVSNLAVALAESGRRVVLIGFDRKGNSFPALHPVPGWQAVLQAAGVEQAVSLTEGIGFGHGGICCIEAGTRLRNDASLARHLDQEVLRLLRLGIPAVFEPDVVLYDIPAENGSAGMEIPVLDTLIRRAYLVASADLTTLYAANALVRQLQQKKNTARVQVGIIANALNASLEESMVRDFARLIRIPLVGSVPRSLVVRHCELFGKTVLEAAPDSNVAYSFRKVATRLADATVTRPAEQSQPRESDELQSWARGWGDRICELEQGIVHGGAGI